MLQYLAFNVEEQNEKLWHVNEDYNVEEGLQVQSVNITNTFQGEGFEDFDSETLTTYKAQPTLSFTA